MNNSNWNSSIQSKTLTEFKCHSHNFILIPFKNIYLKDKQFNPPPISIPALAMTYYIPKRGTFLEESPPLPPSWDSLHSGKHHKSTTYKSINLKVSKTWMNFQQLLKINTQKCCFFNYTFHQKLLQ